MVIFTLELRERSARKRSSELTSLSLLAFSETDEPMAHVLSALAWFLSSQNSPRYIFGEQKTLLARTDGTSSSAKPAKVWPVIETHVVLSAGDGRQTYLNDSVTRSRDKRAHPGAPTARVMSAREHSLRIISKPR